MAFTPRLTRPEAGNKYYIRRSSGGYSTAIAGKPTDKDCDVLSNCVGYAVGRFHEIAQRPQFDLIDTVNAENIFANAKAHGLKTGDVPTLGALIVWQKGATLKPDDGAGHVAVVEAISEAGGVVTITTSESGYGCSTPFWTTVRRAPYGYGQDFKLLGFVYQPEAVNPYPAPTRVLSEGCAGRDVQWLQWELIHRTPQYLREGECDGVFGTITLGAVLAYQQKHMLELDGVCGPETRASLMA